MARTPKWSKEKLGPESCLLGELSVSTGGWSCWEDGFSIVTVKFGDGFRFADAVSLPFNGEATVDMGG